MEEKEILELLETDPDCGMAVLEKQYGGPVRYAAAQRLDSADDVRQCVQDAFSDFYLHRERFDPEKSSLATWLTAVTRNAALTRLKAASRQNERQDVLKEGQADAGPGPEEQLLRRERTEDLRRALERLPQKERTLFYRKYYYLQSTAQIAAELGMSARAVEGRLYRLRQKLREMLGGEEHA